LFKGRAKNNESESLADPGYGYCLGTCHPSGTRVPPNITHKMKSSRH